MPEHVQHDLSILAIPVDQRNQNSTSGGGKGFLFFLLLVIATGAGWFYWNEQKPVQVKTGLVKLTKINQKVSVLKASGYVTPRQRATMASKITGLISELFVEEGMNVSQGQVLARLDDREAQDSLETALADLKVTQASLMELKINLSDAQRKLTRAEKLYSTNTTSQEYIENAQIAVNALRAKIDVAQKQIEASEKRCQAARQILENYTIKAPFSGVVVSKDAQIGEIVSPMSAGGGFTRTGIATIVNMQSLEIEVDVNESYIARVKEGQIVEAVLDSYPDWRIPARVRAVIPTADRQKATVKVRILFEKLDPKILPDMGVKVSFFERENAPQGQESILSIPQNAILLQNEKAFVFVFKEDHVERRAVQTGYKRSSEIEIKAGLREGELIVMENVMDLKDGQKARRLE